MASTTSTQETKTSRPHEIGIPDNDGANREALASPKSWRNPANATPMFGSRRNTSMDLDDYFVSVTRKPQGAVLTVYPGWSP
jgi:hypothetical protein